MKKTIFYLAAAAAMAVACDMENAGTYRQEEGVPFSLEASISSTKTTLDTEGYKVSWEDDDALSVIAGYADGSFKHYKFEKGEGNTFSCQKVSDPGNITTLDVFYPYDENNYAMDGDYGRAGLPFGVNCTQTGTGDAGHIDGALYGHVDMPAEGTPEISVAHASALFEVQVKNSGDSEINVTEIKLSNDAGKNMTGWFQISTADGTLNATNAYKEATLPVEEGSVGIGETGLFYITTAPFDLQAGSVLTVTVTASGADYVFEKTMESDEEGKFAPGTVNFLTAEITDIQEVDPDLTVGISPSYIAPVAASGTYEIQVTSTGDWRVIPGTGTEDWLSVDKTSGTGNDIVTVTLSGLSGGDSDVRTGTVLFRAGINETVLTIQHGYAQEIGGLVWAKANVDEPGTFASAPDDPGMLYQYNSRTGWENPYPDTSSPRPSDMPADDGTTTGPAVWAAENDPCPEGWRVPAVDEVAALVGSESARNYGWLEASSGGFSIPGAVLGLPEETAKSATPSNMLGGIFLPCSGNFHYRSDRTYQNPGHATMNTATGKTDDNDGTLRYRYVVKIMSGAGTVLPPGSDWSWGELYAAYSVRCVAETSGNQ